MNREARGLTLIELIISLILLSIIVLGLSNIDLFSHFHMISSGRRAEIQNEISPALEHMSKEIVRACGNEMNTGADSVVVIVANSSPFDDNNAIIFTVDNDNDGIADTTVAYRFRNITAPAGQRNQIWYCPQCFDAACTVCTPAWGSAENVIAKNITSFTPGKPSSPLQDNFVTIQLQACWDPAQTTGFCNSPNNPSITMKTDIKMPSVSTN